MANSDKKKIRIKIAGNNFTVLSSEDDDRTYALAETVDRQIKKICTTTRTSITGAAILSALNYYDELQSIGKDTEALKKQLAFYLEELIKLKEENEGLKDEIKKLRTDLNTCRRRLKEQSPPSDEPVSAPTRPVRRSVSFAEAEEAAEDDNNE